MRVSWADRRCLRAYQSRLHIRRVTWSTGPLMASGHVDVDETPTAVALPSDAPGRAAPISRRMSCKSPDSDRLVLRRPGISSTELARGVFSSR